jgi:hypothetical protein
MELIQGNAPLSSLSTMHQAPMPPWRNDEEAEDYKRDPRQFLLDRLAILMPLKVFHNWIITATYYMPAYDTLPGGHKFYRSDAGHDEALWQGKVGLVIGKGPLAFLDEGNVRFHGQNVNIGDWIQYDILEGRQFTLDRVHCRRLKDTQVVLGVPDPALVY